MNAQPELFTTPVVGEFQLDCADAVDWLASMPSESVDLCITDPAYESLEKHRAVGTTTRLKKSKASSNEWFPIFRNARFPALLRELYRVLTRNSHLYMFTDVDTMFVVKPIAEAAGLKFWKPIIWDKGRIGMGYHYRNRCERILFFEKGKRRLADLSVADVLECSPIRGGYPTEKPSQLMATLIRQSSSPGELVIDPFMGSGVAGAVARAMGRRFAGCDINESAVSGARVRIKAGGE
jgi:site-specific DNA-methyltransferase (adenine-specific)